MVLNLSPKLMIDRKFRSHQKQSLNFVYLSYTYFANYFWSSALTIDITMKYCYYSLSLLDVITYKFIKINSKDVLKTF